MTKICSRSISIDTFFLLDRATADRAFVHSTHDSTVLQKLNKTYRRKLTDTREADGERRREETAPRRARIWDGDISTECTHTAVFCLCVSPSLCLLGQHV